MLASKNLDNIIVETESNIELVTYPEIDDPIFFTEPTTETLNNHVHEENLRHSTPVVSLPHLLLKYYQKIR